MGIYTHEKKEKEYVIASGQTIDDNGIRLMSGPKKPRHNLCNK